MLSAQIINHIKSTVPMVCDRGVEITKVFYTNLLLDNPEMNEIFNQGNQANGHQAQALAAAIYAYAQNIENPDVLGPTIKHISQKHASLFIKPAQYDTVGKYLLGAFSQVLGEAFTSQLRDAWSSAYSALAKTMIDTEAELYRQRKEDWTDWKDFAIQEKHPESSEITSFILRPTDGKPLPTYLPGQYVSVCLFVPSLNYSQARQYSLSDRYTADHYRISVKREESDTGVDGGGLVSNALHDLKVGDKVKLSRPYGDFILDTTRGGGTLSPLVLISAGVGQTPMISMLNTVETNEPGRPVAWIHGYRNAETRAFAEHVDRIAKSDDAVHTTTFCSRPQPAQDSLGIDYDVAGRVNLDKCDGNKDLFLDDDTTRYYVCGPSAFMHEVKEQLQERGVEPNRISMEVFGAGSI